MILAKLDLKNREISFGDLELGLGFRDLSAAFPTVLRLKRLPGIKHFKNETKKFGRSLKQFFYFQFFTI